MIQAFARRLRRLFGRLELPVGDVAGESWADVGALPPASLMPVEEPGLIHLDLPAPPPLPMDARRPRSQDDLEWEATLARMLSGPDAAKPIAVADRTMVEPDPTPTAPFVTQPEVPDVDDWDAVIARARARVEEPPTPVVQIERRAPAPAPVPDPVEDDGDWETLILAAKARAVSAPPRRAAALVRTPAPVRLSAVIRDPGSEDRAWEEMIARAKRRRPQTTGETGDWSAVIAAAKLRHQHDRA